MDYPKYRDTTISPNDLIAKLREMQGCHADPSWLRVRGSNSVMFDAGFSAAIALVWDAVLEMKRDTFNAQVVKHNASVTDPLDRLIALPRL